MTPKMESRRVGGVRPSQLMYTYGVGALVDLPNLAVIVSGLDDWDLTNSTEIREDRLLAAVRTELGPQIAALRSAPWLEETRNIFDDWARTGIPVLPFPRWMRCPRCGLLSASIGQQGELFNLKVEPSRPDRSRFVHTNCNRAKSPTVLPARFLVACTDGHIDDFPWVEFCHSKSGGSCVGAPSMEIQDRGRGTRSTEVQVKCRTCGSSAWVSSAFSHPETMPLCRGREAHLRRFKPGGCTLQVKPMLLGASNAWFPLTSSALSIPESSDPLKALLLSLGAELDPIQAEEDVAPAIQFSLALKKLKGHAPSEIWNKLCEIRGLGAPDTLHNAVDLRRPEWDVFTNPDDAPHGHDFELEETAVPVGYRDIIDKVVKAERLREVVVLTGFTRVDGPDSGVDEDVDVPNRAPLSRNSPEWLPAAEVRGEGIFISLREDALSHWEDRVGQYEHADQLRQAHVRWRARRGLDTGVGWRGNRYTLLHSMAHLLINEFSLECGYSAASIRERIYCGEGSADEAMAGVLLYTSAPDSEGTLGGLVSLARPETLDRMLSQALERASLCASDPLCAEHVPHKSEDSLHLAACHACLFVPETSCERGNRYLDRALVVPTLSQTDLAYFST